MDNKRKVIFKYIMSYMIPMPLYPFIFFLVTGFNIDIYNFLEIRGTGHILEFIFIIQMTVIISYFNYLAYKSSLKNIDKNKNKKIFTRLVLLNMSIITSIIVALG